MKLSAEIFGHVTVIHTPEDLTERMGNLVRETVRTHLGQGRRALVLDMTATETFDSEGLESLLDAKDEISAVAGTIKICGLTKTGAKVFEMTRLNHHFDLFESLIDAVKSNC